ncbi:PPOX class F420-dependent oxidoreductase [Sphaerisporangium fuscum]|uniref:PPOX class F420-dependent oxidoreductase n=1 Tax=Sphaerisporangium fuscum TaxID=2835868 RepID=UPI001BDD2E2D|nr:PPOX class F420-dependent oxidoreductase [Sphaerisporangium fuscum]
MDLDKAREFLRGNHRAVMLTTHPDGRPQMSPVTVGVDAEGYAVVSTRETAAKTRNLRRNPAVTLCVMNDGFFGAWIQIDGTAEIVPLPEAMEPLVEYYRSISGEHPDWDDYRAAMERDRRVIVRIDLKRAGPDTHR